MQEQETGLGILAMRGHGANYSINRFLTGYIARLREEFVGIAYQLLLDALRSHVAVWKRQILPLNVCDCKAGACVSLTHKGMLRQSFGLEDLTPLDSVTYVWQFSIAIYIGGITAENADVMEPRCRFNEFEIYGLASLDAISSGTLEGLVSNEPAVHR